MDEVLAALKFGVKSTFFLGKTAIKAGEITNGLATVAMQNSQPDPDEVLRELKTEFDYEPVMMVFSQSCPTCRTSNEVGDPQCFICGSPLSTLEVATTGMSAAPTQLTIDKATDSSWQTFIWDILYMVPEKWRGVFIVWATSMALCTLCTILRGG